MCLTNELYEAIVRIVEVVDRRRQKMFTVLIRFRQDAREQVFSVDHVEYHPTEGLTLVFDKQNQSTNYATERDGKPYADAYVMNGNGKTVARYVLVGSLDKAVT